MSPYRCIMCRRSMRWPAMTVTRAGVTSHLGPKCAARLPALKTPKDKPPKVRTARGGRKSSEQIDWVNEQQGIAK